MLRSNVFKVLMVLGRCYCQQQKWSSLVSVSCNLKAYPVGRFIQGIHIINQTVVGYMPFSDFMADDRLRRRNVGIIGYIFRQVVRQVRLAFYLECNRKKRKK